MAEGGPATGHVGEREVLGRGVPAQKPFPQWIKERHFPRRWGMADIPLGERRRCRPYGCSRCAHGALRLYFLPIQPLRPLRGPNGWIAGPHASVVREITGVIRELYAIGTSLDEVGEEAVDV